MTNVSLMAISPTMLFMFVLILPVSIYVYDQHKKTSLLLFISIATVDWFYGKLRATLLILIDSVVNISHNTVFVVSIL